jgi:hypothetical protein
MNPQVQISTKSPQQQQWAQQQLSQGVDPNAINQALQKQNQPSFLEKLLPTAGGILGGIGGGALGALVPGLGETGVSEYAGGVAGASAGEAVGQGLENLLTGQKQSVTQAAVEGGVGQAAGGVLGGLFGKGLGAIGKGAESIGAKTLAGQATPGLIGPDLAKELYATHRITNLSNAGKISDTLTGSADSAEGQALINKAVEKGLNQNHPGQVDLTDLTMRPLKSKTAGAAISSAQAQGNLVQKAISDNYLTPNLANGVRSRITAITGEGTAKNIAGQTDPISALKAQRAIADQAATHRAAYINSGNTNNDALNLMNTYQNISNNLRDRIFSPIVNGKQADLVIPDNEKSALISDVQKHLGQINPKSANAVTNEIASANTYKDLRAIQAKWVTVNQAITKTDQMAAKNYGISSADLIKANLPVVGSILGGPKAAAIGLAGTAIKNKAIDQGLSGAAQKVSAGTSAAQKVAPILSRMAGVTAASVPNIVGSGQQGGMPSGTTGGMGGNITTSAGAQGAIMGNSPVEQAYNTVLNQLQTAAPVNVPQLAGVLAQLAPLAQKQQLAATGINQLQGAYQNAPTGLSGALESLIPGTAAQQYGQQAQATQGLVGQALGIPSQQAAGLIPGLFNTQAAQQRQSVLQAIMQSLGGVQGAQAPMPAGQ